MAQVRIELTEEQAKILAVLAAQRGVCVAELIRQGVETPIETAVNLDRRQRASAAAGRFHSGGPDLSTEHDRYLAEIYEA